jgi:hypothetical protein
MLSRPLYIPGLDMTDIPPKQHITVVVVPGKEDHDVALEQERRTKRLLLKHEHVFS